MLHRHHADSQSQVYPLVIAAYRRGGSTELGLQSRLRALAYEPLRFVHFQCLRWLCIGYDVQQRPLGPGGCRSAAGDGRAARQPAERLVSLYERRKNPPAIFDGIPVCIVA